MYCVCGKRKVASFTGASPPPPPPLGFHPSTAGWMEYPSWKGGVCRGGYVFHTMPSIHRFQQFGEKTHLHRFEMDEIPDSVVAGQMCVTAGPAQEDGQTRDRCGPVVSRFRFPFGEDMKQVDRVHLQISIWSVVILSAYQITKTSPSIWVEDPFRRTLFYRLIAMLRWYRQVTTIRKSIQCTKMLFSL